MKWAQAHYEIHGHRLDGAINIVFNKHARLQKKYQRQDHSELRDYLRYQHVLGAKSCLTDESHKLTRSFLELLKCERRLVCIAGQWTSQIRVGESFDEGCPGSRQNFRQERSHLLRKVDPLGFVSL